MIDVPNAIDLLVGVSQPVFHLLLELLQGGVGGVEARRQVAVGVGRFRQLGVERVTLALQLGADQRQLLHLPSEVLVAALRLTQRFCTTSQSQQRHRRSAIG